MTNIDFNKLEEKVIAYLLKEDEDLWLDYLEHNEDYQLDCTIYNLYHNIFT